MSTAGLRHVLTLFNTVILTCSAYFTHTALSLSGMRSTCICIEISIFFVTDFVALLSGQLDTMNVTYFSLHCISAWSAFRSIYLSLPTLYFMSQVQASCIVWHPDSVTCWNQLFSPSEDGQERLLRLLQSHGKVVELLLHQETSCLLRQVHSHHGAGGGADNSRGSTRQFEHFSLLAFGPTHCLGDWMDEAARVLLTCGLCELCRRRR